MKKLVQILFAVVLCLVSGSSFGQARLMKLEKISNPTMEQATNFFNWTVEKHPMISTVTGEIIPGFSEFRSSKGYTLHVGNSTYSPVQPLVAFGKTVEAMDKLGLEYTVNGVGSFDNDANIFAQFNVGNAPVGKSGNDFSTVESQRGYTGSSFTVGGKEYKGLITMAKGNDETTALSFWLTIICIVCQNTFRAALAARKKGNSVIVKQTKNSGERVLKIEDEIAALFGVQETVVQTLNRMAQTPITLQQAEKAFLGLVHDGKEKADLSDTGKTRLANTLDRYKQAFTNSPGTDGKTVEDWFNAVTYVDTHGNTTGDKFDASKQFVSSEFGTYADRKEKAFKLAGQAESWDKLVETGESIMQALLAKPVVVAQGTPVSAGNDFARLLGQ